MRKTLIPFLFLMLSLTGCLTVGQKKVPHGISPQQAEFYTQTTTELYSSYEYLDNNRYVIELAVNSPAPIISNDNLNRHSSLTNTLIENAKFNYKFTGKLIEDTGFNLGKPIGILSIIGIIAAIILFPSILTVAWIVIKRLRKTLKGVVDSIEKSDDNSTKTELLERLSKQLDKDSKLTISTIKHS